MSDTNIVERLTRVETRADFLEKKMISIEANINDLSHKVQEMLINQNIMLEKFTSMSKNIEEVQTMLAMKGAKWFLEKILLPVMAAAITAIILRFL